MIDFKPLTTAQRPLVQSYTLSGERQNCDLSFANLISWRFLYGTEWAVVDDFLCFRFYSGRHLAYMMPLPKPHLLDDGRMGVLPQDECKPSVLKQLRDDAIAMGHPFLMLGVCNYMTDIIEEELPGIFQVNPNRDFADYVYTREKLFTLSGKKLQSKRNHANRFRKQYQYEYRELTPDMIPECLRLEHQWRAGQEEPSESQEHELRSMTRAFRFWDELDLRGGSIWVEGRLVAFTFGCPINNSTFDVCVEKADTSYDGAFAIINQEFVQHLPEQYFYVNREEDMGDEGLRFAKLSYKPDILLEKNVLMEQQPLADFLTPEQCKAETKQLWRDTFKDPEAFIDLYFNKIYRNELNITCQIDHHVAGALQTLPMPLGELEGAYVSGVSVREELRRQHIGRNLMAQAHFAMYHRGTAIAFLIPAEDWLQDWYGAMGYVQSIDCVPLPAEIKTMSFADYDVWQKAQGYMVQHDSEWFSTAMEDIALAGDQWQPTQEVVPGMARVINAELALEDYARRNPEAEEVLLVRDSDIPMNNAYYYIKKGEVRRSQEPSAEAHRISMRELTRLVMKDMNAKMALMMN